MTLLSKTAQQSVRLALGTARMACAHPKQYPTLSLLAGRLRGPCPSAGNAKRWAVALQSKGNMKLNSIAIVPIVFFMLVSCVSAVEIIPTETVIPTFTPTTTITPLPTATSTLEFTPTPTSIPQAWLNSVKEFEGEVDLIQEIEGKGWIIEGVTFDPASLFEFPYDYQPGGDDEPRFHVDEDKHVQLRCYGEITLPNGSKVITGFDWFHATHQVQYGDQNLWEGLNYLLGMGAGASPEIGGGYCSIVIKSRFEQGKYDTSFTLVFNVPVKIVNPRDELLNPLIMALSPPIEFWQSGDISLLPKVMNKHFLLATSFLFKENK